MNLCCHKDDFGLDVTWNVFATGHGKSAVDGVRTIKLITARASFQKCFNDQILTVEAMYNFFCNNMESVIFKVIHKHKLICLRGKLGKRYEKGDAVPGTRSHHQFFPLSSDKIAYKR